MLSEYVTFYIWIVEDRRMLPAGRIRAERLACSRPREKEGFIFGKDKRVDNMAIM